MASLVQTAFVCTLLLGTLNADNSVMDSILKRFEEMNTQLANLNGRVAELEKANLEKTATINNLQKQLGDQNEQLSVLTSQQRDNQRVINEGRLKNERKSKTRHPHLQDDPPLIDFNQSRKAPNSPMKGKNWNSNSTLKAYNWNSRPNNEKTVSNKDNSMSRRGRIAMGEGGQVAFSANISPHDYGPIGDGQIILFDNVLTNVGNAYHAHNGIFTAPIDGVYVIYVTISGWKNSTDHSYLELVQNGSHLCWIWVTAGDQSSQAVVVSLSQNDDVYVKSVRANDILLGATYSSFSGILLF